MMFIMSGTSSKLIGKLLLGAVVVAALGIMLVLFVPQVREWRRIRKLSWGVWKNSETNRAGRLLIVLRSPISTGRIGR